MSMALAGCSDTEQADPILPDAGQQGSDAGGSPGVCIGPDADDLAVAMSLPAGPLECANCAGSRPPGFELADVQPQSCSFGENYDVGAFQGRPTVVALLAAWCSFCQSQSTRMEQMRNELAADGLDVNFVIINGDDAGDRIDEFIQRVPFPILQDTVEAGVWEAFGGAKDDIFVYDSELSLVEWISPRGETPYNLSEEAGYAHLRAAIMTAAEGSGE
jgi:thiol-disulfide isomerase/thioredoxin